MFYLHAYGIMRSFTKMHCKKKSVLVTSFINMFALISERYAGMKWSIVLYKNTKDNNNCFIYNEKNRTSMSNYLFVLIEKWTSPKSKCSCSQSELSHRSSPLTINA